MGGGYVVEFGDAGRGGGEVVSFISIFYLPLYAFGISGRSR